MADVQAIEVLLEKVAVALSERRRLPESTYRLQFHADFTFAKATAIVPYLHDLGVSDCYASPYLKARPGSKHGYDISDHRVLNPEIGTDQEHDVWARELKSLGMGQILDIVPNHMGIVGNQNVWWNDVLENGPSSPFAGFFDIDWYPEKQALRGKVLLPILGAPYGKVLESGQLVVRYEGGTFAAYYFDHRFPIAPETALKILRPRLEELEKRLGTDAPAFMEYQSILTALGHLPSRSEVEADKTAERQREKEVIKRRLATLADSDPIVRDFVEQNVAVVNGREGDKHSFDLLDDLLNDQAYRLSSWRVAADEINFRRFFDVNELAAVNMEKEEVFEATHSLILKLLGEGKVTGLRIDHPDGLYDPRQYLERLQVRFLLEIAHGFFEVEEGLRGQEWKNLEGSLAAALKERFLRKPLEDGKPVRWEPPLYVAVEKILGRDEPIPEDWPVNGTTGYEFLNVVNGVFVDASRAPIFSRIYFRWGEVDPFFADLVYQKKFLILQVSLSSELHMLAYQLDQLSEKNRRYRDFTLNSLRHALREIIACFPVYRSYITEQGIQPRDREYVETAVALAKRKNPAITSSLFDFVRSIILMKWEEQASDADRIDQRRFVGKFQQVTGPVMAKGLEDTAFYVYNRLVSLNEVGGDPGRFGVPLEEFHRFQRDRQAQWPYALSASSTHDTKRSEDVRARLNVLSEIPREWQTSLSRWNRLNKRFRMELEGMIVPDRNDEYLLYQTLLGAWPLEPYTPAVFAEFVSRVKQYMEKALHEAKVHTSWVNPNPVYDEALPRFLDCILDEKANGQFLEHFRVFQKKLSHYGLYNSLSQTLLKIGLPGVPDVYQGTELWDFSLVDPDNRRPVDYERRRQMLEELKRAFAFGGPAWPDLCRELTIHKEDGRIKLYTVYRGLHCRSENPGLFSRGEYIPVEAAGTRSENVCAFVRCLDGKAALVVVPRLLTGLIPENDLPLGSDVWQETCLSLPLGPGPAHWRNIFTNEMLTARKEEGEMQLSIKEILKDFPVALLLGQ